MKHLKLNILVCFLLLTGSVGAQQWYFNIDERQDAKNNALQGVHRVMVVNNALVQPSEFGHSTVLDGHNQGGVSIQLDRALLYTMFALTQTLDESGEMDAVELLDISQNTSTNYYSRQPMTRAKANELLAFYDVEALLVLNQLVLYDVLEAFRVEEGGEFAYLQAFAQSHWNIYYADQARSIKTITYADTLVWESDIKYTRQQVLEQLPVRQEALLYAASTLGDAFGMSLLPSWVSVRRYLYDHSNPSIQAGIEAFRYQRWEEAIGYWQLVMGSGAQKFRGLGDEAKGEKLEVKGKDKKAAAVAAANIAIAYELLGDYSVACDYANAAFHLFGALKTAWGRQQQVNIRYYLEQLQAKKATQDAQ